MAGGAPAKRLKIQGFRTENAITRLSRIRLTTIFKAEYITFRGASFWMGPENSRQSQFRDQDRILIFEARKIRRLENFGGYKKGSRLGNFTFINKLKLKSGDPNNCYMNRKNKWVQGSK